MSSGPDVHDEGSAGMFKHRMIYADGTPADPPIFVSAIPNWRVGDDVRVGSELRYRIVCIDYDEERDQAVWTVEPVGTGH